MGDREALAPVIAPEDARAIGAFAAALAIPHMDEAEAAALAEAHGIVCHLTSLVLVDEAGQVQGGLPDQRKVPLMTPAFSEAALPMSLAEALPTVQAEARDRGPLDDPGPPLFSLRRSDAPVVRDPVGPRRNFFALFRRQRDLLLDALPVPQNARAQASLRTWIGRIDWSDAERLRQGDTSILPTELVVTINAVAGLREVVELAREVRASARAVVIALIARAETSGNRNADRVFRAVLGNADPERVDIASRAAGL